MQHSRPCIHQSKELWVLDAQVEVEFGEHQVLRGKWGGPNLVILWLPQTTPAFHFLFLTHFYLTGTWSPFILAPHSIFWFWSRSFVCTCVRNSIKLALGEVNMLFTWTIYFPVYPTSQDVYVVAILRWRETQCFTLVFTLYTVCSALRKLKCWKRCHQSWHIDYAILTQNHNSDRHFTHSKNTSNFLITLTFAIKFFCRYLLSYSVAICWPSAVC